MFKKTKIYILIAIMVFSGFSPFVLQAKNFTEISDKISTSRPGFQTDHLLRFKVTETIPPGGKIIITPEEGEFYVPPALDYTDIDLATSSFREGPYTERSLFSFPTFSSDGISISGASSSSEIEISLRNTLGISAGTYVRIKIGLNASYGEEGDEQIINPGDSGSYGLEIRSYDDADNLLDRAEPMVAILPAVTMQGYMPKIRSRGSPSGTLSFGTVSTIMSLVTNYKAYCRYSTASNTPFSVMDDDFAYTGNYFHSITLTGLGGGFHIYFIRCQDQFGVNDASDYEIYFYIETEEEGSTSGDSDATTTYDGTEGSIDGSEGDDDTDDGGSGGGGGGGGGGGSGPSSGTFEPYDVPLGDPAVEFSGLAYPNSQVSLLVDGELDQDVRADGAGNFNFGIEELPRGTYTFGLWAQDPEGSKSLTYNTTFYVEEGTKSAVSDIFISPTISSNATEINIGDAMELHGYGAANTFTEVWFYPYLDRGLRESEIIKQQVDVGDNGLWNMILNTDESYGGQYRLKARSNKEGIGYSEFSNTINIGVGEPVEEINQNECAEGDLNSDGRVNITDFSIMLYHWGTDNDCADQNDSGNVDLIDFSIMMFYWTG